MKQERETAEGSRTGSQPVVAGRISQGLRSEKGRGGKTVGTEPLSAQAIGTANERQWELKGMIKSSNILLASSTSG